MKPKRGIKIAADATTFLPRRIWTAGQYRKLNLTQKRPSSTSIRFSQDEGGLIPR